MKNLAISTKIGVNGNVPIACEFRVHDGLLFWHGAPKKFAQPEHDKYIWRTNACIGKAESLPEPDIIQAMVRNYLRMNYGVADDKVITSDWGEPKLVNEKNKKRGNNAEPAAPTPDPDVTPDPEPTPEPSEPANEPAAQPTEPSTPAPEHTPQPQPAAQTLSQQDAINAFAALTPLFAGVEANVQANIMKQLAPLMAQLKAAANNASREVKIIAPNGEKHDIKGVVCDDFDAMVQTLYEGDYIYLYGPSGCGKSYTAMQLAEAVGVPFYGMQQLLYEHQVVGFVDANGTRHETPFTQAWQHGGLVLLDEFDGSAPEAAICVNNALANGIIALPGVGNVKAHEDFRVVAAGNTTMTGADIMYTARQVLDASTIDRFFFVGMDYDKRIELDNARGDQSIVDFAHDVRQAIAKSGLYAICSYRCIKRLGNVNLQQAWGDAELLKSAFTKSLGEDDIRLIYNNLENTSNRWAKALKLLTSY